MKWPDARRQVAAKPGRVRYGQGRLEWVDVQGSAVNADAGPQLFGINTKHTPDIRNLPDERKTDANPRRPFAFLQNEFFVLHLETRSSRRLIDIGDQIEVRSLTIPAKRILRAFYFENCPTLTYCDRDDTPAGHIPFDVQRIDGVIREGAERAVQIGSSHSGQLRACMLYRRVVGGHVNDRDRNTSLSQNFPKRPPCAERAHARIGQRKLIGPNRKLMRVRKNFSER